MLIPDIVILRQAMVAGATFTKISKITANQNHSSGDKDSDDDDSGGFGSGWGG